MSVITVDGNDYIVGDWYIGEANDAFKLLSFNKDTDEFFGKDLSGNSVFSGSAYEIPGHDYNKSKPRTKVLYEHLTQSDTSVWDLKKMLENGELFAKRSDDTYDLYSGNAECYMIRHFIEYGVYRKIDWKDELSLFFGRLGYGVVERNEYHQGEIGLSMEINEIDFISMCHLVASLTDKPE